MQKMEKKHEILELRERLDKTLAMPDLVNEESIKSLVKNQLLRSSFCGNEEDIGNIVEKRTMEVSNFLEMLRTASGKDRKAVKAHEASYKEWKIKQDTDQLRVMYREGPHGTPFHILLAEGFADGPIDVCLCVSWESTLYKKWWPQYNFPTFKITTSTCLKKIRIGEEISLIRVKVAWPVSDREALLHYTEIEYFKEDLIIVLLNTISDTEHIDISMHGFSRDGIPEAKDTVRIDLVGGFVLQKVDTNRSYFRAIATMDIKLDFVPPWLINFISRQLIGNGHKLYQKAVGSVATSDEDYRRALQGPMYARIREGLDSCNNPKTALVGSNAEKPSACLPEEHTEDSSPFIEITPVTEIVEEETENSLNGSSTNPIMTTDEQQLIKERALISPEVEHALRTLDQAIAIVRSRGFSDSNQTDCFSINQGLPNSEAVVEAGPISDGNAPKNSRNRGKKPANEVEGSSPAKDSRNSYMGSAPREDNYDRTEISSSKDRLLDLQEKMSAEATVTVIQPPVLESLRKVCDEESLRANGFHENGGPYGGKSKSRQAKEKKQRLCCLSLSFFRG